MNLKAFLISALPFDNVHLVGVDGWGQNMDHGSMDPLFGPGPWTTFMDRVHGPPVMDQVHAHFFEGFAPGPWTLQKQK